MVKRFQPVRGRVGRTGAAVSPRGGIHHGYEQAVRRQLDEVLEEYRRWAKHMNEESVEVLREALEPTLVKARDIYCPVKDGDLRDSAYLEARQFRGNSVVEIGFGKGGRPHYAAMQHERLDFYHEPPTRAKFLQVALEEDGPDIEAAIIKGLKTASGT